MFRVERIAVMVSVRADVSSVRDRLYENHDQSLKFG